MKNCEKTWRVVVAEVAQMSRARKRERRYYMTNRTALKHARYYLQQVVLFAYLLTDGKNKEKVHSSFSDGYAG